MSMKACAKVVEILRNKMTSFDVIECIWVCFKTKVGLSSCHASKKGNKGLSWDH